MRKVLFIGNNILIMIVFTHMAIGQVTMPEAISIDPPNATAWDEITLTLDPNLVERKQSSREEHK